ncbi:MAG: tape measure protein [Acidimicrobiia bacterium]
MAINLGAAYVDIVPSTGNLARQIRSAVERPLQQAGSSAGSGFASGFTSAIGSMVRSTASAITSGLTAAGQAAMRGIEAAAVASGAVIATSLFRGWDRLTTIQDATAALTISMGSAAGAAALLDRVLGVVTGTPFNLDQFAAAAQRLVGFGVDAEKVPNYLTAIGEAAATQGKRANEFADRLATVFGQIAASGQVQLIDVWRISDAGVNALAILANAFGVTREEMKDMISAGAVPAERALDALAQGILQGSNGPAGATVALAGTMEALRDQLSGSAGGLGAAMARFGASILTPFAATMTSAFRASAEALDLVGGAISDKLSTAVDSPGFQRFAEWVRETPDQLARLLPRLQEMGPALVPIGAALAAMSFRGLATVLGPFGAVIPTISPIFAAFAGWVATNDELRTAFIGLGRSLSEAAGRISRAFQPIAERVIPVLADGLGQFVNFLADRAVPALAGFVTNGLNALTGWWDRNGSPLMRAFNEEGLAGVVGMVVTRIRDALPGVIDALAAMGQALIDWVRPRIGPFLGQLGEWLMAGLHWLTDTGLPMLGEGIKVLVPALVGWITNDAIPGIVAVLPDILAAIGSWAVTDAIPALAVLGKDIIVALLNGIKEALKGIGGLLVDAGKDLVQGFIDGIKSMAEELQAAVHGTFGFSLDIQKFAREMNLIGRARGGPVTAGVPYLVGERGPELFLPAISGMILPNRFLNQGSIVSGHLQRQQQALADHASTLGSRDFSLPESSGGDTVNLNVTQYPGEDQVSAGMRALRWHRHTQVALANRG